MIIRKKEDEKEEEEENDNKEKGRRIMRKREQKKQIDWSEERKNTENKTDPDEERVSKKSKGKMLG